MTPLDRLAEVMLPPREQPTDEAQAVHESRLRLRSQAKAEVVFLDVLRLRNERRTREVLGPDP